MISEELKKLLESANIKIDDCYITEDNIVFTPLYDKDFNIVKTSLEVYEETNKAVQ